MANLKSEWSFLKQEFSIKPLNRDLRLYTVLDRPDYGLIQIGYGPEGGRHFQRFLKTFSCHTILHYGLCGGLTSSLHCGDIFISHKILSAAHEKEAIFESSHNFKHAGHLQSLKNRLQILHIPWHEGNLLTSHKILSTESEKKEMSHNYSCDAVDMEAYPIAEICSCNNPGSRIKYLCIRGVFDEVTDDLEHMDIQQENGDIHYLKLAANILRTPPLITRLPALKKKLNKVQRGLREVVRWFITG